MKKEKSKIKKEIEELRKKITHHERLYYIENKPEISDVEFDKLMKHLESLEKKYPEFVTEDSPTQRVGGEPIETDGALGFTILPAPPATPKP